MNYFSSQKFEANLSLCMNTLVLWDYVSECYGLLDYGWATTKLRMLMMKCVFAEVLL